MIEAMPGPASVATQQESMRAARLVAPGKFELVETPVPEPGADEVRVRVEGCGVCASSMPVWQGRPWFQYPLPPGAPGHEAWGVVDKIGDHVTDVSPGDRVAILCQEAHADFAVAPAAGVVRVPPSAIDADFPGEPLGCAMNVLERADLEGCRLVVVVGIGFLGVLLTQLMARAGIEVIAVSRRNTSLEAARSAGAKALVEFRDVTESAREVMALTVGEGARRVIEAAGVQDSLQLATDVAAVRGRVVIAGYHQDGHRQVDMQSWNWRGIDVICAHERSIEKSAGGMLRAAEAVADGALDPRPFLTHRCRLAEIEAAYELTTQRPDGFIKAVVLQ